MPDPDQRTTGLTDAGFILDEEFDPAGATPEQVAALKANLEELNAVVETEPIVVAPQELKSDIPDVVAWTTPPIDPNTGVPFVEPLPEQIAKHIVQQMWPLIRDDAPTWIDDLDQPSIIGVARNIGGGLAGDIDNILGAVVKQRDEAVVQVSSALAYLAGHDSVRISRTELMVILGAQL